MLRETNKSIRNEWIEQFNKKLIGLDRCKRAKEYGKYAVEEMVFAIKRYFRGENNFLLINK